MANDLHKRKLQEATLKIKRDAHADGYAEGYEDGYQAAVKEMTEFAGGAEVSAPKKVRSDRIRDDYRPKIPRGVAAKLAREVLQSIAPRAAGPTEVMHMIKRDKEMEIPFTTVRRGFDQLQRDGEIEEVEDTKTWRLVTQGIRTVK